MFNMVIFGPPGAGKGTQSQNISRKYDLFHLSTGDVFREEMSIGSPVGLEAKKYIDQGMLVPDDLVVRVLCANMQAHSEAGGYLFDGYPRTLPQAEMLDDTLLGMQAPLSLVISMEVAQEELINRLKGRAMDSGRSDDSMEIIRKRQEVYRQQTLPLIDYYERQGKIERINGMQPVSMVFRDICRVIDRHQKH